MIHRSLLSSFVEFHSTESSSSPRKKKQNKQNKRIQPERPSPFSGFVNSKERRNETKKKGEENNKKGKGSNWTLCRSFRSDGAAAAVSDVWRRTATRMGADVKTEETGSRRERMYVKDRERQSERERERDSQQPPSVRRRHAPAADSFGSGARRGRKDKKKRKTTRAKKKDETASFVLPPTTKRRRRREPPPLCLPFYDGPSLFVTRTFRCVISVSCHRLATISLLSFSSVTAQTNLQLPSVLIQRQRRNCKRPRFFSNFFYFFVHRMATDSSAAAVAIDFVCFFWVGILAGASFFPPCFNVQIETIEPPPPPPPINTRRRRGRQTFFDEPGRRVVDNYQCFV